MSEKEPIPDFTGKAIDITMEPPVVIGVDPATGRLYLEAPQLQLFGATLRVHLSPPAARQLVLALKQAEQHLGTPIEDLAKPDSVQ